MAKAARDKIEYEFDDLRRNTDPISNLTLAQLGIEPEADTERQEGKRRKDSARKDDDEFDRDDRDALDDDEEVTLTRKELARELTRARQEAERNARKDLQEARAEATTAITKLTKRLDGVEKKSQTTDIASEFDPKISDIEKEIEAAMEAGESVKVIQLNKQLAELIADKKMAIRDAAKVEQEDDEGEEGQAGKKGGSTIPRAQEWLDEQPWWDDPKKQYIVAYVNSLDGALQRKGYRPTEDAYYEQLERQIEKKFPGVITLTMGEPDEDGEDDDDRRGRRRSNDDDDEFDDIESRDDRRRSARRRQREAGRRDSPVGDDRGGDGRERRERRERDEDDSITLTRAQIANMRAFQLDPDNPKHVEEYMLEAKRNRRESRRR